ncbi:MAG TPA: sel1 repeat family protein [Gammaproteobacteria bacterium]|nr:sel1 repeat family protein [Gammaproteobacteria bacterium]
MYRSFKKPLILLLVLLLTACTSLRTSQEIQLGKSNFEAGYYRDAFRQLLSPAIEGNAQAQYAIGYMYYYGYGVPLDTETGSFWIKKAADQHYQPAVQALAAMQKAKIGVDF